MQKIRINEILEKPIEEIPFLTISQNSFEPQIYNLPIYVGFVENLPKTVDAIVATSDLQGIVIQNDKEILLGEILAKTFPILFEMYFPNLELKRSIAILCGDLYTNLLKRGTSGNPINVWKEFSEIFKWTIGVAGNHDDFGDRIDELNQLTNVKLLLNETISVDKLTISGLSGIIGRSDKNFRLRDIDYYNSITKLIKKNPDFLLTHLSPAINSKQFIGDEKLTVILENGNPLISFCGHVHWDTNHPVVLANETQVLNLDTKVYILIDKNNFG